MAARAQEAKITLGTAALSTADPALTSAVSASRELNLKLLQTNPPTDDTRAVSPTWGQPPGGAELPVSRSHPRAPSQTSASSPGHLPSFRLSALWTPLSESPQAPLTRQVKVGPRPPETLCASRVCQLRSVTGSPSALGQGQTCCSLTSSQRDSHPPRTSGVNQRETQVNSCTVTGITHPNAARSTGTDPDAERDVNCSWRGPDAGVRPPSCAAAPTTRRLPVPVSLWASGAARRRPRGRLRSRTSGDPIRRRRTDVVRARRSGPTTRAPASPAGLRLAKSPRVRPTTRGPRGPHRARVEAFCELGKREPRTLTRGHRALAFRVTESCCY